MRGGHITDQRVIRQILKHLGLWTQTPSRDYPDIKSSPKNSELVYELFDDLSACKRHRQMVGQVMMILYGAILNFSSHPSTGHWDGLVIFCQYLLKIR